MKNIVAILFILLSFFAIQGFASTPTPTFVYEDAFRNVRSGDTREFSKIPTETRLYFRPECIVTGVEGNGSNGLLTAVAAVVVPKLIESVLDKTAAKLSKSKIKVTEASFYDDLYFYKDTSGSASPSFPYLRPELSCMTVITGKFLKTSDAESGLRDDVKLDSSIKFDAFAPKSNKARDIKKALKFKSDEIDDNIIERLARNGIFIVSKEGFYSIYEGKLVLSADYSAFRVDSQLIKVSKLLSGTFIDAMVYEFDIVGPGNSPDSQVYSSVQVNLGKMVAPFWAYGSDIKQGAKSGNVGTPGMSKSSFIQFLKTRKQGGYTPVKFSVKNIQTKQPSDTAKFFAAVINTIKPVLVAQASSALEIEDKDVVKAEKLSAQIKLEKAILADKNETDSEKKKITTLELLQACNAYKLLGGEGC